MKKSIILTLVVIGLLAVAIYLHSQYTAPYGPIYTTVAVIESDIQDLSTEFEISLSDYIISPKYQMTCHEEQCSYDVRFNTSYEGNKTNMFFKIRYQEETFRVMPIEVDNEEDTISFTINNPTPDSVMTFYAVVVYNPNMRSAISQ